MAKAHVLDSAGAETRVAFHIAVPAGNNSAGIAWSAAVKNSGVGSTTVLEDGNGQGGTIGATEKAEVTNGTVFEKVVSTSIPAGMNAAQANAFLDALHADLVTEVQADLQARLAYFGYTRA